MDDPFLFGPPLFDWKDEPVSGPLHSKFSLPSLHLQFSFANRAQCVAFDLIFIYKYILPVEVKG